MAYEHISLMQNLELHLLYWPHDFDSIKTGPSPTVNNQI